MFDFLTPEQNVKVKNFCDCLHELEAEVVNFYLEGLRKYKDINLDVVINELVNININPEKSLILQITETMIRGKCLAREK